MTLTIPIWCIITFGVLSIFALVFAFLVFKMFIKAVNDFTPYQK